MSRNGFTLMEILAVLLILAVVVSFALPGIRLIRDEIRHSQAKAAAIKMADAMRSYYHDTKGYTIIGEVFGKLDTTNPEQDDRAVVWAAAQNCDQSVSSGIPTQANNEQRHIAQLFACGYLSTKDFAGLPYQFVASDNLFNGRILIQAIGTDEAGRHAGDSWYVHRDLSVSDCGNNCED